MKNIVITSFGGKWMRCGEHFVDKVIKYSDSVVDKIIVYNIGDLDYLFTNPKVAYKDVKDNFYDGYLNPKQFAWVSSCLWDARNEGDNILWMDAGQIPLVSLKDVFKIIREEGVFCGTTNHNLIEYRRKDGGRCTSKKCIEYFNLTDEQKKKPMLSTAIFGYNIHKDYKQCVKDHYETCKIKDIVFGNRSEHNSDQSVLSCILAKTDYVPLNIEVVFENGIQKRIYYDRDNKKVLEVLRIKDYLDYIDRIMRRYE